MPSEAALQLVQEAKLSQPTGSLRAYHTARVRHVRLETRQLHAELAPMAELARAEQASGQARPNAALAARLVAYHLQADRNKRGLLAYHRQRRDWLRARVWDKAGALSLVLDEGPEGMRASLRTLLDPTEFEWLRSYAALVALYKDAFLDVLDVTWPITQGISPAQAREALGSDFRAPASSAPPRSPQGRGSASSSTSLSARTTGASKARGTSRRAHGTAALFGRPACTQDRSTSRSRTIGKSKATDL